MKKYLLICCAAFALVGCSPNEGGTGSSSDQNAGSTSSGSSSSVTSTNRGTASSPGSSSTSATPDTNAPSSKP